MVGEHEGMIQFIHSVHEGITDLITTTIHQDIQVGVTLAISYEKVDVERLITTFESSSLLTTPESKEALILLFLDQKPL